MKNLVKYTLFALVAVTLTGCIASDFEDGTLCRDGVLTFDLSTGDTRTGTPNNGKGDGTNDDRPTTESVIKDIQFFLYKRSADATPSLETDDAIFAGKITGISAEQPDTYKTPAKSVSIPAQTINQLFENASKCDIYVIVNYIDHVGTDLITDLTKTSRKDLKSLPLTFKFSGNLLANSSFVMDSELMTVSRGTGSDINKLKADDIIYVTRAAAKILIEVNVENSITVNGETWQPYTQSENESDNDKIMTLSFFNGVKYGIIDDDSDTNPDGKDIKNSTEDSPYYSIENMQMLQVGVDTDITNPNTSAVTRATTSFTPMSPLYTYTSLWVDDDSDVPYFMLTIPWRKVTSDNSATWVNYEYKIPISKTNQFVRNKLYLIRLTVGALGDLNYLKESVLEFNVLDWNSQDVNVSLDNPRYLVVNEHNYEMDNVEEILIPYSSSHTCEIVEGSLTISQVDLLNGGDKADHGDACTAELVTIDGKTYIKVYNDLDNDLYSSGFDFTEYNISVSIQHEGNSAYKETVYITQYPAIYGTACENSDYSTTPINDNRGYVWTNGYTGTSQVDGAQPTLNGQTISNFGESGGIDADDDLDAKDMYVITVSATHGTKYVVGDPRKRSPENSWNWGTDDSDDDYTTRWYTANNLKGVSQAGPQYYYPTDGDLTGEANNPNYNMLAPKFRVCSAYGAISASQSYRSSYGNVKGRCASYQEDGYPAGRWRLPTAAEFELINVLSNKGLLPTLYVTTMDYWSAHGYGRYTSGEVDLQEGDKYKDSSISVRCVYDDWYWGSEPVAPKDQFTWGDEPRPTATAK